MAEKQQSHQMDLLFDQANQEQLESPQPMIPEIAPLLESITPKEPPFYPESVRTPIETATLQKVVRNLSKYRRWGGFLVATSDDSMYRAGIVSRYKSSKKVDSLRKTDEELEQVLDEAKADFHFFIRVGNYALKKTVVIDESIAETHTVKLFDRFYDMYYHDSGFTRRRNRLNKALKNEPKPEDSLPNNYRNARVRSRNSGS